MRTITIGGKKVGEGEPVFIIAEAGVNHSGSFSLARKLIDAAAEAGADAIKFQTFRAGDVVLQKSALAPYQRRNLRRAMSQHEMLRSLEFREGWYKPLMAHAKKRGIMFLSTPHGGIGSANLLRSKNVPAHKIASPDLTNLPLLSHVARLGKPVILSTGMATLEEVKEAVRVVRRRGNWQLVVLQCTTNYPLSDEEVHLRAMDTIGKATNALVGFSDHTLGITAPIVAAARGACVIEKHLTLNTRMKGPDHRASLTPAEFKRMVSAVRRVEQILGSKEKSPTPSEKKMIPLLRKSVVVLRPMKAGERFSPDNLGLKRPGTGLPPSWYEKALGKRARRAFKRDEMLSRRDISG